MDLSQRTRSVNIDALSADEAEALSAQIGEKVRQITDKAVEEANRLLNIYGMEAKMQIAIGQIGELEKKAEKPQKTRKTRKKKDANL